MAIASSILQLSSAARASCHQRATAPPFSVDLMDTKPDIQVSEESLYAEHDAAYQVCHTWSVHSFALHHRSMRGRPLSSHL